MTRARASSFFVLALVAGICAFLAAKSVDWMECDQTAYIPIAFLLLGAGAAAGAVLSTGPRLGWVGLAAVVYGVGVAIAVFLSGLGHCTS